MRDYILSYSPYQRVQLHKKLPEFFIYTSTYDDRVHPGHARKMTAKLQEHGHRVWYHEEFEGGHAGNLPPESSAKNMALRFCFAYETVIAKK